MKLWSGRFSKKTNKSAESFNSSIGFDNRLYKEDIIGSIGHVKMLGATKIIPAEEAELIEKELQLILHDISHGVLEIDKKAEDIHTFIEGELISRIGDVGKKLHTGRSRNDQVAFDLRLYLKKESYELTKLLSQLLDVILKSAHQHTETIMPGFTHLQKAQPTTLAHYLMAYFEMFKRDIERVLDGIKRIDILPLGSGALAGTTYPLDRELTAKLLGFAQISQNSLDAVSDRDFVLELNFNLSMIMMHLSRFAEEIIIFSSQDFGFWEVDDAFGTGSSIMPQKKNPDVAELVRGKTGRVYGNLVTLLTVMKAQPLAYNKDMQEDKEAIFDSLDTAKCCIELFAKMLHSLKINKDKMAQSAGGGFTNATDLADYLVVKGIPFRDAHEIVGKIVVHCLNQNIKLEDVPITDLKEFSPLIEKDIFHAIKLRTCINRRNITGGPSPKMVRAHIQEAHIFLDKLQMDFILNNKWKLL